MSKLNYDFLIIGGGATAFAAATVANKFGARAALIEKGSLGGTCVNSGCIPSKYLVNIANRHYYAPREVLPGLTQSSSLDFSSVVDGKNLMVEAMRSEKYESVLEAMNQNVKFIGGEAFFTDRHEVSVNGKRIVAKKILVATGASPFVPPISGLETAGFLTSSTALNLKELPLSLLVIGAGTIGLEFAQMFAHLGSKVTLVQDLPKILPQAEQELSDALFSHFSAEKIRIYTQSLVESVRSERGKIKTRVQTGKDVIDIVTDKIMIASGRRPNTKSLQLEKLGVELGKKGRVMVDKSFRSAVDHIYAAGDVIGEPMLQTVAAKEGTYAAENALAQTVKSVNYLIVPRTVYTSPQYTTVGLTEKAASAAGIESISRTVEVDLLPKAQITGHRTGIIKMVAAKHGQNVIGVHILSDVSSEIIQEAVVAIKHRLTLRDIVETPHIFPSMAELVKYAAQSFTKDMRGQPCCTD